MVYCSRLIFSYSLKPVIFAFMFRFEHPAFFWSVILVVAAFTAFGLGRWWRNRDKLIWASNQSYQRISAGSRRGRVLAPLFILTAMACLVLAAVNPQWGFRSVTVEDTSADIYIMLDISTSMLAEDVPPSRLERAKRFAIDFAHAFSADKIGLIFFAGSAYLQSPLTTDRAAIQLFLNAAHPDQAGTQGTAIGDAIRLAIKPTANEETAVTGGALVLITDGEDHDSDAIAAMEEAKAAGWTAWVIGAGTTTGAEIPITIQGMRDSKRDENGLPVKTALNRQLLEDLARAGNGRYYDLSNPGQVLAQLQEDMHDLVRTIREKRTFSEHKSYFQWFLLPAIILLLAMPAMYYKREVV